MPDSNDERRQRGIKMFEEVYGGVVPFPPKEYHDDFLFLTIDQLFSEVWSRPEMSVRDRRLVAMGVIAALGEATTFEIQVRAALKKGELSRKQVEELLIFLPYYVGYPRATSMRAVAMKVLAETKE